MKQKIHYLFMLLLMLLTGVGGVKAQNEEIVEFSKQNLANGESRYSAGFTFNNFRISFGVENGNATNPNTGTYYNTGTGIRIYASEEGKIIFSSANDITKIVITCDKSSSNKYAISSKSKGYKISSGSCSINDNVATWTGNSKEVSFTNTSGSEHWRIQKVVVTYQVTTPSISYNVTLGDDNSTLTESSAGAGVTLPGREDVGAYSFLGWSETNVNPETTTKPEIIPAGNYKPDNNITLYPVYSKTETIGTPIKNTANVTISNYAASNSWSNDTQYKDIAIDENVSATASNSSGGNTGKYYTSGNNWRFYQNEGGKITVSTTSGTLNSVKFTFTVSNTGTLNYNSSALTSGTAVSVSGSSAEFTVGNSGNATNGQVRITAIEVAYTTGGTSTTYYTSVPSGETPVQKVDVAVLNSITPTTLNVNDKGEFTLDAAFAEGTVANEDYEVSWESDNAEVLAVSGASYEAKKEGTANVTVTVTVLDDEKYNEVSKSFAVTVNDPNAPGTQNNPYTVAQARAAIDASSGVTGVYAKGIVSKIVTAYNSQYGNISYNISADGTTTADQLQAYRGKSYNGKDFTSADDIQVGDEVVVYGNLEKYNSTYEFAANNQLVSLERKVLADAELAFEKEAYDLFLGEEFVAPLLINPHSVTVTYSSSDENIATVNAETGEVTIHTKGVTTISATSSATDTYKAGNASYTLTVKRELVENEIFYESFDNFNATGGNDEKWSGSIASGTFDKEDSPADNVGWTSVTANAANKCAKIGSGNNGGNIETPAIQGLNGDATISFLAGGWDKTGEQKILKLYIDNGTITPEVVTVEAGKFSEYKVEVKDATPGSKIKFAVENKENRIFIDEISIVKKAVPEPITLSAPIIFHDSGEYEDALTVAIAGEGTIKYQLGDDAEQTYTAPFTISKKTTVKAWTEQDGATSDVVTREYTIVEKAKGAVVEDGYYTIQTNDDKYVNVAGRKTVTLVNDTKSAGTVIRVKADEDGVKVLRSQAVDLPRYAERAMSYVPEIVKEVVKKLAANVDDPIIGEQGADLILDKFNKEFDYHLYLEGENNTYRIYGRTPSMKPVVDFYAENKELIDGRLLKVEGFVKEVLQKVVDKVGRGQSVVDMFKVKTIWQNMGGTLTEPTDDASTLKFYEEVLSSETNVWNFAYQTGMLYWEKVKGYLTENAGSLGDYGKYIEKIPQIRPNFKYYIVPSASGVDIISEGNSEIKNASTAWTLTKRESFDVTFDATLSKNNGKEMYKTLYVDFGYKLPDGVTALKVTAIDENTGVAKTEEIGQEVAPQTPVLLKSDKAGDITLNIGDNFGSAVTDNLLKGNDYLINTYDINTSEVEGIFNILAKLSQSLADEYSYLKRRNVGTVNNKYFFWLTKDDLKLCYYLNDNEEKDCVVRSLSMGDEKLGFYNNWTAKANEAFLVSEQFNPVKLTLKGDVNRSGDVTVADVNALVEIVLGKVTEPDNTHDFDAAHVNADEEITIADVTALVNIILGKTQN
ncbi:MAG: dockerin type I repeat-containing protein [Aeriscardovia sp.]|nr:dockerin type I repeat-containing protein [Aeriscardovia sp.]